MKVTVVSSGGSKCWDSAEGSRRRDIFAKFSLPTVRSFYDFWKDLLMLHSKAKAELREHSSHLTERHFSKINLERYLWYLKNKRLNI